ncbi:hypothetical protein PR202_gb05878 [Eleusine coracana subsp. coracana]|uniref:SPX domain-containing protein n=1 Tax=Eleusine coracana subsp. coracana TaxID=191504 RepID=A0AAV5E835_ELECO|nr:hypothetical protein QOZ80_1BG0070120 [Eleusine coracana subsp. coracana]GJN18690.1 hypothetical protein PR202_gb05878 [Eleusine coracana subsp. coracana]
MKFGKWLKRQIEQSLPEWQEQFLCYKELKRCVKAVSGGRPPTPEEEAGFLGPLDAETEKIDTFFLDQEEECVIRHLQLQEEIKRVLARKAAGLPAAQHEAEAAAVRREIVNFHGKMVLLLNYSNINYIGLVKILKKYDKVTGAGLLLPAIASLRERPFFNTDTVSQMVRACESMLEAVPATAPEGQAAARHALAVAEESIFRNTVAALLIMQDVRAESSTRGSHSLPPLDLPDSEWLRSFQIPIFQ